MITQYEENYLEIVREAIHHGDDYNGRGTIAHRRGLWQVQNRVRLSAGATAYLPVITVRKPIVKWAAEELRWMLSGSTFEPHLRNDTTCGDTAEPLLGHSCAPGKGPTIWAAWATSEKCADFGRRSGDLGPVYGHAWRNAGATVTTNGGARHYDAAGRRWINAGFAADGVDQLARLMAGLDVNPFGTRHVLSGWIPSEAGLVHLPPCHTLMQFRVRVVGGAKVLDSALYQRSADLILGVPTNMTFYCLLTHVVAKALDFTPGVFVHNMADAHIYGNQLDEACAMLNRKPLGAPELLSLELEGATPLDRVLNFTYGQMKLSAIRHHEGAALEVSV